MARTVAQMVALRRRVLDGLGVRKGEDLDDVARRIMRDAHPGPRLTAAEILIRGRGDGWDIMEKAANALGPAPEGSS